MTTTAVDDQHAADPHAITVGAYVRTPNGRSGRVLHIQGETAEVAMPRGDNDTESVVYLMEYLEPMAGCATQERKPALGKVAMLKVLARELRVWPEDSTDCAHTEPTGWGWQWMDQAPDCEFVLSVIGRDGREWTISEREWRDARWGAGEERIDRIAQSDASGDHYPPTCADGLPCGVAHSPGDDAYCLHCPHEPLDAEGQEEFDASMRVFTEEPFPKQARYQDARGEDWIDEFARTATADEFRGAMRFTIGKYCRRAGKKDALVSEITKIEDYARRWREYELAREGDE